MLIVASCSNSEQQNKSQSTTVSQSSNELTGNAENDATEFAAKLIDAYNKNDVNSMKEAIDTYYEFYKERPASDIKVFFNAFKDKLEPYDNNLEPQKWEKMIKEADKYEKMETLYKLSNKL